MRTSLSPGASALWAKSGEAAGVSLIAHLLDVAAAAWAILEREPDRTLRLYATDLNLNPDINSARGWVCALVGLHDLGKASPTFQCKWEPGAAAVRSCGLTWSDRIPPKPVAHGLITQWSLEGLLEEAGWAFRAAQHAADAVGAHHGFRGTPDQLAIRRSETGGESWDAARRELVFAVTDTLDVTSQTPGVEFLSGAAFMRLAGLTSFADWIGSSLPVAPFDGDLARYFRQAVTSARARLDSIGWHHKTPLSKRIEPFGAVFSYLADQTPFRARPLQTTVETILGATTEQTLLLIEAPTGEGKTEAAFYAHLHMQRALGHRGLYVALPTQATGNMMFSRTRDFLEHVRTGGHLDLQLLHGATLLNEAFQAIVIPANVPEEATQTVAAREWFTYKKRALLSEYGVGTVDQALLSVLNAKHQFVRLWGLANRTVIIDEIHAYDAYTSGLITSLIRWLYALGSSVIVMSATLPAAKRKELLEAFGATRFHEAPYPRVTQVTSGECTARTFSARHQAPVTIRQTSAHVPDLKHLLVGLAEQGGCIACIVNTVQRAQDLYRQLERTGLPLWLFHARYPAVERRRLEVEVANLFGRDTTRRPQTAFLIATQVVEQSLDLDFDVMVTDLAPIDLVLQRAGRLHRHDLPPAMRHGHMRPILYVAGMLHDGLIPQLGRPFYFDRIYERHVLLRTWAVLKETDRVVLPEGVDHLVQVVYGDADVAVDLPEEAQKEFADAEKAMTEGLQADRADARAVGLGDPLNRTWERVHPVKRQETDDVGHWLPALTRKGAESVTVVPIYSTPSGYALNPDGTQPVSLDDEPSFEMAKAVSLRTVRLSRRDVVNAVKAQDVSRHGWAKSALLRDCHPLVLDGAHNVFDKVRVVLVPTLGIVYEKMNEEVECTAST